MAAHVLSTGMICVTMALNSLVGCRTGTARDEPEPTAASAQGGTSYYVDAEYGRDSYSGRLSEPASDHLDGPFRTIQAGYGMLQPGDCLYVRQGVYRETVTLDKAASEHNPIVIQAFPGHEGKAIVSGAQEIRDWQKCLDQASCAGNPNWRHVVYANTGPQIKELFQAGLRLAPSRYPNRGWLYPTSVDKNNPDTVLLNSRLRKGDTSLVGSICHVKTNLWHIDQIPVQAYSPGAGRVTLESPTRYTISPSCGHYFTHCVADINEEGEWAYDRSRGRIYLWPIAGSPENVEGTSREYGIDAEHGCSYHTIQGLVVKCAVEGIWLYQTQHMTLKDNRVEYAYNSGIFGFEDCDTVIVGNTICYANHTGIENQPLSSSARIEGNTVYATGVRSFGDDLVEGIGYGLFITGRNAQILRNRVDCSAYTGILVGGQTSGRRIAYNYVTNSCLSLADGGGIYTGGHSDSPEYDRYEHNIVADVWGYLGGWAEYEPSCTPPDGQCRGAGYGIYLDEQGNHRTFEYNTAVRCSSGGIYFHWTQGNQLVGNKLYGNGQCQLLLSGRNEPAFMLRENNVQENFLIATEPDQNSLQIEINYQGVDFGDCDHNYFYHPQGGRHIAIRQDLGEEELHSGYTLAAWTDFSGKDAHSMDLSPEVGPDGGLTTPVCLINPSMQTVDFDLAEHEYRDAYGDIVRRTASVGPFDSVILFPRADENHALSGTLP
jgi:parallel beta-helix repeat protein